MVERGLPIDLVLTADTGIEFPEMYCHWNTQQMAELHCSIAKHTYFAPKISGSSHIFTINTVKPRPIRKKNAPPNRNTQFPPDEWGM